MLCSEEFHSELCSLLQCRQGIQNMWLDNLLAEISICLQRTKQMLNVIADSVKRNDSRIVVIN